jgi:hypothetical protein
MLKYARMAATKNYPFEPQKVRTMVGSVLWWQFGLQMQAHDVSKLEVLLRPHILATALRMVWEVRSLRVAWRVRQHFRRGV